MAVLTNESSNEVSLPEDLLKLLVSLAKNWEDIIDASNFKLIPLKGAMTNEVYRITWPSKKQDDLRTVLVRVYGEGVDHFFNRDDEIKTFECISEHGYGPKLLGHFPDGRVEEFIHARTLSAADIRDPKISALIADKLREFHKLDMPGPKSVALWERLRNWLGVAKNYASPEQSKEFRLHNLDTEIALVEQVLSEGNDDDIGFCHNDLQYGNIMIDENTNSITIIDYEYASYNPIAYDIANHFCEMVADYHTNTPHVLDYTKFPSSEERQRFIRLYLTSKDHQPSEEQAQKLADRAEKFTLANHLFWGLWGIISAHVNNIDFDYMEYARQRFQQYWLNKHKLL